MSDKRKQSKAQLRNLVQNRSMTEEEFEEYYSEKQYGIGLSKDFEERIQKKIAEFGEDYDIDDLKINDKETLRSFVQAIIALEDYERLVFDIRTDGDISQANINVVDRLNGIMSNLRKDISRFQEDLNITRKIRKSDKESSVINYIANLKEQARQYKEDTLSYVLCECGMLVGNVWCLYPEENNVFQFTCSRVLADGSKCGKKTKVTSRELMEKRGTNRPEILPESLL